MFNDIIAGCIFTIMKNWIIVLLSIISFSTVKADGIEFFHGTFEEAKAAARNSGKIIFIDCYTTWCGPCKMLQNSTFPDAKLGEFFNSRIISFKVDCEKDAGIDLCRSYSVTAYPTLLFVDSEGRIIRKALGYRTPDGLMEEAKQALGNNDRVLDDLRKKFNSGDRTPGLLYDYAINLQKAGKNADSVFNMYIQSVPAAEYTNEKNAKIIFDLSNSVQSPSTEILTQNADFFKGKFGKESYELKMEKIISESIKKATINKDQALYEKAVKFANASGLPNYTEKLMQHSMFYYLNLPDFKMYDKMASTWIKKYHSKDAQALQSIANAYYEKAADAVYYKKALKWAIASTKIEDKYYNNLTLAQLYSKLGKSAEALAYAQYAIELGKKQNVNYWPAQDLVNKIQISR